MDGELNSMDGELNSIKLLLFLDGICFYQKNMDGTIWKILNIIRCFI